MLELKYKRIWLLTDLHFGMRSNSIEWLEIQKDYFDNWFFANVKKYKQKEDVLFILGDVFDNRQSTQLLMQHTVLKLFEDFLKHFDEVHVLIGNHDIYRKSTNEITSLDFLSYIPNIKVYKEPEMIKVNSKTCLMMPWRNTPEIEVETLLKYKASDYMFCHSEIQGAKLNKKVKQDFGTNISAYKNFKRIYSGHIHFSQTYKNFRFVGNPYQMTRSDSENTKGIYILDLETDKELFIENDYTPKFLKYDISDLFEIPLSELKKKIKNNFVDIFIPSTLMINYNVSKFFNALEGYSRRIEPKIYDVDFSSIDDYDIEKYEDLDIMHISKKYIDSLSYADSTKKRIETKIDDLFKKINVI